nr:FAD-binding oxidoreductase [Amylibacter sp.]
MTKTNLIAELTAALSADTLLSEEQFAVLDPVVTPENTHGLLAVAPRSLEDIVGLFQVCRATGTALIPQGGRTGLAGAATGTGAEILCLGHKMPRHIVIDPVSRTAEVSANTTLADLEQAARAKGLTAGIDIAARDSATIGGMISTNAGGMEAFRNGTMRQRVLGLQAVLPDGTILNDLAHVRKCNEGYDVKQLLIGGEGTLGIITAATLQLLPEPPVADTFLLALPDAAAALVVMQALQSNPQLQLLRAEAMWRDFAQENAKHQVQNPLQTLPDAALYVIYEVHCPNGPSEDMVFATLEQQFETGLILDAIAAQTGQQANDIWALREDTLTLFKFFPHAEWFDISIPLAHLDSHVKRVETRVAALDPALRIHVLGHLGDGNLHYTVCHPEPLTPALVKGIKLAVLDGLKEIGGSFSAEHGIGIEKRAALNQYGDAGKLAIMRAIKQALDPENICNPGKVV